MVHFDITTRRGRFRRYVPLRKQQVAECELRAEAAESVAALKSPSLDRACFFLNR